MLSQVTSKNVEDIFCDTVYNRLSAAVFEKKCLILKTSEYFFCRKHIRFQIWQWVWWCQSFGWFD